MAPAGSGPFAWRYYKFRDPGLPFLFSYGHGVAGQSEAYAYLGLY
ncbi:MAG TPA: hypothetical protein VMA31_19190 [Bryobacteraceae bacterium]|nr:hypothetical protein [Bryobacteraceae bacterium]